MNLNKILDDYHKKLLKVHGISIHSNMSESDMEEFNRDIWLVGLSLDQIQEILDIIDESMKMEDSTNKK